MSSDSQYTALGPAAVGFQTHGANIDVGVEAGGKKAGVIGHCDRGPGIKGQSNSIGVRGEGALQGVYGRANSRFDHPESTTGVLGEGYSQAAGVMGLCFRTKERVDFGQGAGTIGVSNAVSEPDKNESDKNEPEKNGTRPKLLGAGVVGMSSKALSVSFQEGPLPLPELKEGASGEGTGVWGMSGEGIGVHGQSKSGRGGVFESRLAAQINLKPTTNFKLPPMGKVGDLFARVNNPGAPGQRAELWFCGIAFVPAVGATPARNAQWQLVEMGPLVPS